MNKKVMIYILGMAVLAGCNSLPGFSKGQTGATLDSYFATNVGRLAGHTAAIAALCPSLSYNEEQEMLNRRAICTSLPGGAENCALPGLEEEKDKSFAETTESLAGMTSAQICADARAEAASDKSFADYFVGL